MSPLTDPPVAYAHPQAHLLRIGLAPIALEDWFEGPYGAPDGDPTDRKAAVFARAPDLCWGETEGSRPGQAEALALIEAHLGRAAPGGLPPLRAAAMLVDDDLCLMEPGEKGWTLTAASLCAPSFFNARGVVGKALSELHAPVTGFDETLLPRVARIFDSLSPDTLVERRNWSVVASGELFLPNDGEVRATEPDITPEIAGQALHVRMERQTLRRLPQTGGLLFTIRIWRHPLDQLREDPVRLQAFADAWERVQRGGGEMFRDYKQLGPLDRLVRHVLAEAMRTKSMGVRPSAPAP